MNSLVGELGLEYARMLADGHCLFHAVVHALGDPTRALEQRSAVGTFMVRLSRYMRSRILAYSRGSIL